MVSQSVSWITVTTPDCSFWWIHLISIGLFPHLGPRILLAPFLSLTILAEELVENNTSGGLDGRMIGHHLFHWPIIQDWQRHSSYSLGYGGRNLSKTSCEDIVLGFQKVATEWWIHTYFSLLVEQDIDPKHTISLGVWSFSGLRDTSLSSPEGSWLYIMTCSL